MSDGLFQDRAKINSFYLSTDEKDLMKKVEVDKNKRVVFIKPLKEIEKEFDLSKVSNHQWLSKIMTMVLSLFGSYQLKELTLLAC